MREIGNSAASYLVKFYILSAKTHPNLFLFSNGSGVTHERQRKTTQRGADNHQIGGELLRPSFF